MLPLYPLTDRHQIFHGCKHWHTDSCLSFSEEHKAQMAQRRTIEIISKKTDVNQYAGVYSHEKIGVDRLRSMEEA